MVKHVTLITGTSRGLGRGLARALAQQGRALALTARRMDDAEALAAELGAPHVPLELDVTDPAHAAALPEELRRHHVVLDTVVHNAAVYERDAAFPVAQRTFETNLFGPLRLDAALAPLLAPSARVVFVSSGLGHLQGYSDAVRQRLLDARSTAEVEALALAFLDASRSGGMEGRRCADATERAGFARDPYGVSKALLNALARARAHERPEHVYVAASPGWVQTDMGGPGAPFTLAQGVQKLLHAVTAPLASGSVLLD